MLPGLTSGGKNNVSILMCLEADKIMHISNRRALPLQVILPRQEIQYNSEMKEEKDGHATG